MALGIRGANPIWAEFDLAGKIFDDTFYMYVLQNVLPYAPATVYHDPDLNQPWTDPIRFLGNGTLPVDIFFQSEVVYRLEFRQNDGISTPSQADPLIYEVNNYVAGAGGSTPVDTVAFASSNQITNPQFSLTSFSTPFSLINVTNPDPIEIGPGWFLELAGTGSVSLQKIALNNANANPSNAPYALRLTLNGWSGDGVFLRQRFQQNGMLWANKIVSSTITTRIEGSPQTISASLIDSNSSTLGQVLPLTVVNEEWNEFTGYGQLPATTNPNTPPAAYIDYKLGLPSNVDIYVSSIQLVVQELPIRPSFEQDSIERQIDHTYHTAYPIVPVGTVIDYGGFDTPAHYLPCIGGAYNRQTYNQLFQKMTKTESVTLTLAATTFTVANGAIYRIGMPIEGTGVSAGTTVANVVGNTITMSAVAIAPAGVQTVRFFAAGAGDGSTTFNVYDLRDYVIAGVGGTGLVAAASNAIGGKTGAASIALVAANLPAHTHKTTIPVQGVAFGFGYANGTSTVSQTFTSDGGQSLANVALTTPPTAFGLVQPTAFLQKMIRFE